LTLRTKTIIAFCSIVGGSIATLYLVSRIILLGSFAELEERSISRDVERVRDSLTKEIEELDYTTRDWAWWDETCAFVQNGNEAFIKINLNDTTLDALKINAILFIHPSGRVVFATGFDPEHHTRTFLPKGLEQHIRSSSLLLGIHKPHDKVTGIISLPSGPILVAVRPILTGEGKGTLRGTLVMGRSLDAQKIRELASLTHLSLKVFPFAARGLPSDVLAVAPLFAQKSSIIIKPLNQDLIAGYTLIRDLYGKPGLIVRVDSPRAIYAYGQRTVRYFIFSLLTIGLLLGIVIVLLLDRVVLSRLRQLNARIDDIGRVGDFSGRVALGGRDELSKLAASINAMLVALERSQHEMRKSQADYRALFENMLTGFAYCRIVVDDREQPVDFVYLEVNSVFEKITRLRRDRIIDKRFTEVLPRIQDSDFDWIGFYGRVALGGEVARVERYSEFLGRWYSVSAYSPAKGYFALLFDDITNRKRAEEELRKGQSLQKAILDNIPDIAWLKDRESKFIAVNEPFGKACGVAPEELVGKTDFDIWPRDLAERYRADDAEVMQSGQHKRVEEPLVDSAGKRSWLETIKTPIYDHEGKVIGTTGIARDITYRKRAEEALRRAAEDLKRSNEDLEKFAYVASHDLQEPLRMVASYLELLARRYKGKLDPDADEFIRYAVDGAVRMKALINDLLEYSRLGTIGMSFEPTDCTAALGRAIANLQVAVSESGATVTHDMLPVVTADAPQLVQLFQNLISNAIRFRGSEPPHIHISTEQRLHEWVFSVRDNGIGIDPQFHDRIFVIFQRLHGRDEYPGTGIGLALCRKIVERHGGLIWVESAPGSGSTFYFTIPTRES
jgi:PAS domain S-box-containing protein